LHTVPGFLFLALTACRHKQKNKKNVLSEARKAFLLDTPTFRINEVNPATPNIFFTLDIS